MHVLIRARGGDFVYSDAELDAMRCDVLAAKRAGAHGVVLGALTRERALDVTALAPLVAAARPEMQVIAGRKAGGGALLEAAAAPHSSRDRSRGG